MSSDHVREEELTKMRDYDDLPAEVRAVVRTLTMRVNTTQILRALRVYTVDVVIKELYRQEAEQILKANQTDRWRLPEQSPPIREKRNRSKT